MTDNLPAVATVRDLPARIEYARTLAVSNLLPAHYRAKPENVLLAMEYGDALGIPAIQAINSIHVIEGKPTASADLIAALIRRAGHKLRITEEQTGDGPRVTATLIRADDPDFAYVAVWDRAKARAAGVHGKAVWKLYEAQMMRARAITEIGRQGASDALFGVVYTAEEVEPATRTVEQVAAPLAAAPELGEPEPVGLTGDQATAIGHAFTSFAELAAYAADLIGRTPANLDDLTCDEAALILAAHATEPLEAELIPEESCRSKRPPR